MQEATKSWGNRARTSEFYALQIYLESFLDYNSTDNITAFKLAQTLC